MKSRKIYNAALRARLDSAEWYFDEPFFDVDSFFKRWDFIGSDPETGHFQHRWLGTWYKLYKDRTFNEWVAIWQGYVSNLGKVTEAEKLEPRFRQIFTNLNTDKLVLLAQAADTNAVYRLPSTSVNPITRNTLFRQAIMLAVLQQACLIGYGEWGMMVPRDIVIHPLFPAYAIPWGAIFQEIYDQGLERPPWIITDAQFEIWDKEHLEYMVQNFERRQDDNIIIPTYSKPSVLVKDFEGAEWSDVRLQVEIVGAVGVVGYAIKIKRRGQKKFRTYELHELGLATKKGKPLEKFNTLKIFAECGGFFTPPELKKDDPKFNDKRNLLKKRIEYLRAHFRKIFGIIDGDPIKYGKESGVGSWTVQFAECGFIARDVEAPHPSDRGNEIIDPHGYTAPTSNTDAMEYTGRQPFDAEQIRRVWDEESDKDDSNDENDEQSFKDKDELE
jgi:hypothetical protein